MTTPEKNLWDNRVQGKHKTHPLQKKVFERDNGLPFVSPFARFLSEFILFYFHYYSNKIRIRFLQVTYLWTIYTGYRAANKLLLKWIRSSILFPLIVDSKHEGEINNTTNQHGVPPTWWWGDSFFYCEEPSYEKSRWRDIIF